MNNNIGCAVVLLVAAWAPVSVSAALIDVSDVELTAFASFTTQLLPQVTDSDTKIAPRFSPAQAEALVLAGNFNMPSPNIPTSQTKAFASSAGDANSVFGVGVNGFFFQNSLPPNSLVAAGTFSQTITNNSTVTDPIVVPVLVNLFIPAPTIKFFGVGPVAVGVDPVRDAAAGLSLTMTTSVTHPNGSVVDHIVLDYGMTVFRETLSGVMFAFPSSDAVG